jgi:hypothetical protein
MMRLADKIHIRFAPLELGLRFAPTCRMLFPSPMKYSQL